MYDNYDENSLKVFHRHSKSFMKTVNEFVKGVKEFDAEIDEWNKKCMEIMMSCNISALVEHHYKFVVDMLARKKAGSKAGKKGGKKTGGQRDDQAADPQIVVLNDVEIKMIQSQQEFIKNAVKEIIMSV
jgi:hypothetical protein